MAPAKPFSETRFEALAALAPVGIFSTDINGQCEYVNQRWCEIAGLSPAQALGQGWMSSIHPEDRLRVADEWLQSTRSGEPFRAEYRFQTPDGHVTWVLERTVIEHRDGVAAGYIGTVMLVFQMVFRVRATKEVLRRRGLLAHVGARAAGPVLDAHDHAELRALLDDARAMFGRDHPDTSP